LFWICETGEDNEKYCYPKEWNEPGFFEDFFDDNPEAIKRFWNLYNRLYKYY
jgi:hypothetical protein